MWQRTVTNSSSLNGTIASRIHVPSQLNIIYRFILFNGTSRFIQLGILETTREMFTAKRPLHVCTNTVQQANECINTVQQANDINDSIRLYRRHTSPISFSEPTTKSNVIMERFRNHNEVIWKGHLIIGQHTQSSLFLGGQTPIFRLL